MSISAFAISEVPVSGIKLTQSTNKRPPKKRRVKALRDSELRPEPR